jgi:glycosyltransferase involved in cell wall biosynthesis
MRIVVLSPYVPFPANRGGLADVWRRMQAMSVLGHDVMLVAPVDGGKERPEARFVDAIERVTKAQFYFPIIRSWRLTVIRLLRSFWVPWHAATRIPAARSLVGLQNCVREFQPDVLWLEGPWLGVVGKQLSKRLGVPLLYRSHNVEASYMLGQAKLAMCLRTRLTLRLSCIGLRRFEIRAIRRAVSIFDISMDDLEYWKGQGIRNLHWLPPLPEIVFRKQSTDPIRGDLVFVGNLSMPNNVRGVEWLLTEVLPRVRAQLPNVRCRIVGSNPSPHIRQLLTSTADVELCADVPDTVPYLFGARVLLNPVLSGSGVQVKMLDMLMTDAPIVTASQGTRGFPAEVRTLFRVADDADAFAQAVCEELRTSSVDIVARARARDLFSVAAVSRALEVAQQAKGNDGVI